MRKPSCNAFSPSEVDKLRWHKRGLTKIPTKFLLEAIKKATIKITMLNRERWIARQGAWAKRCLHQSSWEEMVCWHQSRTALRGGLSGVFSGRSQGGRAEVQVGNSNGCIDPR